MKHVILLALFTLLLLPAANAQPVSSPAPLDFVVVIPLVVAYSHTADGEIQATSNHRGLQVSVDCVDPPEVRKGRRADHGTPCPGQITRKTFSLP